MAPNLPTDPPEDTLERASAVVAFLKAVAVPERLELEGEELDGLYYILDVLHSALDFKAARRAGRAAR